MRTSIFITALLTVLAAPAMRANSLVVEDYKTVGDHDLIVDTLTDLEWLSVSYTEGLTVSQALAQNPGYQLATPTQVEQMFNDAGGGFTAYDWKYRVGAPDETTASVIIQDFGATTVFNFGGGLVDSLLEGHVLRPFTSTYDMVEIDYRPSGAFQFQPAKGAEAQLVSLGNVFGAGSSIEGNFLVNVDAGLPEPSTWMLMAGGLAMLVLLHAQVLATRRRTLLKSPC